MLNFKTLPIHRPPEPVSAIALHNSLYKIAVARANGSVEVWTRSAVPIDSHAESRDHGNVENTTFKLTITSSGIRHVTIVGIFWDFYEESQEAVVVATLSGQFIVYSAANLGMVHVSGETSEGFYAVAQKAVFMEQTMNQGLYGLTPLYAAACGSGTVKIFGGSPAMHLVGAGSKNMAATKALSVCFSSNGKIVYVGDDLGGIQRFDLSALLQTEGSVRHIAAASAVCNISFDSKRGAIRPAVLCLCCSPGLPYLVAGTSSGDVFVVSTVQNTVVTNFRVSKAAITSISFTAQDAVLAGSITRDLTTLVYANDEWHIGKTSRRVHCNDITSIATSAMLTDTIAPKLTNMPQTPHEFLCVTGGADGELFVATSSEECKAMLSKSILEMKRNVLKYSPYLFRSEAYVFSVAPGGTRLLTASTKDAVCVWKVPKRGNQIVPFVKLSTKRLGYDVQHVAMSRDSSFLMYASTETLHIKAVAWAKGLPTFTTVDIPHDIQNALKCIQSIALAYNETDGWIALIVANDTLFSIRLADGVFKAQLWLAIRVRAMLAQNSIAVILTEGNGFVVWNELEGKVMHSCNVEYQRLGVSDDGTFGELLIEKQDASPIDSRARIADMCFLTADQMKDYTSLPTAVAFVNAMGHLRVVSIESASLGMTLYASLEFCPNVYPLPVGFDHTPFAITCTPKEDQCGVLLRDVLICIWNASHVILFDLSKHYDEGSKIVQQTEFRKMHSVRAREASRTLSVVPTRRLLTLTSVPKRRRKRTQKEVSDSSDATAATQSTKLHSLAAFTFSPKEFMWKMRVYEAKRFAT